MNKVYLYNLPANNIQFSLYGKGGNEVIYQFRNGNITLNQAAYFMTGDPYFQMVLEDSQLFKDGTVSFDKETAKLVAEEKEIKRAREVAQKAAELAAKETAAEESAPDVDEDYSAAEDDVVIVSDVKSVAQAVNYVQENFGEVARTAAQARSIAAKHGVSFPNLKVSTKTSKE